MTRSYRPLLSMAGLVVLLTASFSLPSGEAKAPAADNEPDMEILNLERLNTAADEDDPCTAPDGVRLYFTSNASGNVEIMAADRHARASAAKSVSQGYTNAKRVQELCGASADVSPFPLPRERDGSEYIFFASQRDVRNFDIYFTRRLGPKEPFSRIAIAGINEVCTPLDELHPWLVQIGQTRKPLYELYFSRKTVGGWRVGVARGPSSRVFDKVELVDLPPGYYHPSVSSDGLTMYLQGPVEKDRFGLFVSRRATLKTAWGRPEPLQELNSQDGPVGDCSPSLSRPTGRYLYFASDRAGGKGGLDLYVVATAGLKRELTKDK